MIATPEVRVPAPTMRVASFEDYDAIAGVESAAGLLPRPHERWTHLWRGNPAYAATPGWPIGWVLEERNGRIVGSIGNVPSFFHLRGRVHLAATLIGWGVEQAYRNFSLMLVAHQTQFPGVDLHLVNTAAVTTSAIFTKLKWSRVPVGQWDRSALWITRYSGAVSAYLRTKFPGRAGRLATIAAHPAAALIDRLPRPAKFKTNAQLDWLNAFDEGFDEFWSDLLAANPDVLLACRSRETLQWHFRDPWILSVRRGARMIGYAILQRKDSIALGLARMLLVDLQTIGNDPALTSAMMEAILGRCREDKIDVLENAGCWLEHLRPHHIAPSRCRDLDSWCYLYKAKNSALDGAKWYPTQYDGDASL
jgi:hypothetical protein